MSAESTVSFVSANYVAREVGYHMTDGWEQGDRATNEYFAPLETFASRFEALLAEIAALGFSAVDIWTAHLNPAWATDAHLSAANGLLRRYGLAVPSVVGPLGATANEFGATCRLAGELGARLVTGRTPLLDDDRHRLLAVLDEYDLRFAHENHEERTPAQVLERIGDDGGGRIGTAVDTGWYGTQDYDAAVAISVLGPRVLHVHLKDVAAPGGHVTTGFGQGCVPLERCVAELKDAGFAGPYSIEHEPEDRDPADEVREALKMTLSWLAQ